VLPCDRILWLDWGRIIEEDTHPTLANSGNLYARLAKLQFKAARTEIVAPTGPLHQPPFRVRQLSMVGAKASRRCRKPALHAELAA
jgi:hypothetical protein